MIIDNLHIERAAVLPAENQSPLIINSDRVESLPISFETFQPVSRRHSQIPQLGCIMQIKQFSPCCPTKLGREGPCSPSPHIIEQILRKSISEGLNHVPILSEFDNLSSKCFSRFDQYLSEFGGGTSLRRRMLSDTLPCYFCIGAPH